MEISIRVFIKRKVLVMIMNINYSGAFGNPLSIEEHKSIQLAILKYVAEFCENNGLRYFLADGTLIGAIRHKGFIPWDDDIDIQMPRPDLNRLISIFNKQSGSNKFHLIYPKDPIAQHYMVKIVDTDTVKIEPYLNYSNGFLGVDIDVFALDGCPDDEREFVKWGLEIRGYNKAYTYKKKSVLRGILGRGKDIIKKRTIAKFVPLLSSDDIMDKIYTLVNKYPYDKSKYIARIGISDHFRTLPDCWEPEYAEFEGDWFRVPRGYDEILTKQYGDYMKLPPIEKQVTHHVNNVYWKSSAV